MKNLTSYDWNGCRTLGNRGAFYLVKEVDACVDDLRAEVEELRKESHRQRSNANYWRETWQERQEAAIRLANDLDDARAEVERLKGEVKTHKRDALEWHEVMCGTDAERDELKRRLDAVLEMLEPETRQDSINRMAVEDLRENDPSRPRRRHRKKKRRVSDGRNIP